MLKNNDDALHASYSRHLAQGNTIKGLIKFAKDKGLGSPEVWSHNGHYALRYQGRDGETKQLSLGDKYNGARRMILSLAGPQKPKAKPAPAGGTRVLADPVPVDFQIRGRQDWVVVVDAGTGKVLGGFLVGRSTPQQWVDQYNGKYKVGKINPAIKAKLSLGAVKPSMQGTQKPYVSSSRGVYEVLDTRGKTVFKTKNKEEAQAWWKANYNKMMDGRLSLAGAPTPEQVISDFRSEAMQGDREWDVYELMDHIKSNWREVYDDQALMKQVVAKFKAMPKPKGLSLADPLSKGFKKGDKVKADGKPAVVSAIGLSATGKRLAVVQFSDGSKKGIQQSKLKALSLSQTKRKPVK